MKSHCICQIKSSIILQIQCYIYTPAKIKYQVNPVVQPVTTRRPGRLQTDEAKVNNQPEGRRSQLIAQLAVQTENTRVISVRPDGKRIVAAREYIPEQRCSRIHDELTALRQQPVHEVREQEPKKKEEAKLKACWTSERNYIYIFFNIDNFESFKENLVL
ncbi:Hypothetical_protein [Hexamita inflata]|uniref:Hypothetical_protein n=1 Tax=Hexamita inflata TaxID=28002 RepID=A0AA86PB14_9EUKA|nr:Hypothetical protein HINF_LOCUS22046 [Hexamita inflata]